MVAAERLSRHQIDLLPLGLGIGCLAAVAAAVALTLPEASPLSPDHAGGSDAYAAGYLAAMVVAVACYAAGLALLRQGTGRRGAVVAIAIAIQCLPLLAPVLLSTDVYTYWARGRVSAVHGANPYETPPSGFPGDPALTVMGASWRDRPTGYGPAFTLASEAHAAAVGPSRRGAELSYRVVALASMLLIVLGVASLAGASAAFAAAFVGWNPLLAVHVTAGGHNDAIMMALVVAALVCAARSRLQLTGAAWALAIAVKWIPVAFLALRVVEARRTGRPVRHAGFAAVAGALALVATWRYGSGWLGAFEGISDQTRRTTSFSAAGRLVSAGVPEAVAIATMLAVFAVGVVFLVRDAWRGRARLAACAALLVLTTPWLVPWYLLWLAPLAAIDDERWPRLAAVGLTAYLVPQAVPL